MICLKRMSYASRARRRSAMPRDLMTMWKWMSKRTAQRREPIGICFRNPQCERGRVIA